MSARDKPSNIGTQFDNVGTYVLNPVDNTPALRGAIGELCISGVLVGRGYRNRPDLTEKRFQYLERYGERIYHTGDMVRVLYDGSFEFLGRADDQIKLRGQRLEIAEVNEVIKKHVNGVTDVATMMLKHPKFQREQLVSFVVLATHRNGASSATIDWAPKAVPYIKSIREACQARLPSYGIPTHVVPLNRIPLSANNKVDANYLKRVYFDTSLTELQELSRYASTADQDWSPEERDIVMSLAEFLNADMKKISRSTNIFEIGLDSISVIGLAKAFRDEGFSSAKPTVIMQSEPIIGIQGRNLTDSDIGTSVNGLLKALKKPGTDLQAQITSQLAAQQRVSVFAQRHSYTVCSFMRISYDLIEGIAPCTATQEAILTASANSKNSLYFNSFIFKLSADTDVKRLREAWGRLVKNTQVLRTAFCATADGFAQVFQKFARDFSIETEDSSDDDSIKITDTYIHQWRQQNASYLRTPLKVLVLRATSANWMIINIFHALYDGISFRLILRRLAEEYLGNNDVEYGPPFRDLLPRGLLRIPDGAKEFWLNHLRRAEYKPMPALTDRPSPGENEVVLGFRVQGGLDAAKRKFNTTYQALFQACWVSVLTRHLGSNVTVGMVFSGRAVNVEGVEHAIGPLFNTVPFHLHINEHETWASAVRKCHEFNISLLPYQRTPLRDISRWCRGSKAQPLFDTLFVFEASLEAQVPGERELWTLIRSKSHAEVGNLFSTR